MAKEYKFMFDRSFDDIDDDTVVIAPAEKPDNPVLNILNAVDDLLENEGLTPPDDAAKKKLINDEPPADTNVPVFSEKEMQDARAEAFSLGKNEGIEEGREEGRTAGIAEGRQQGITEGREQAAAEFERSMQKKDADFADSVAKTLTDFAAVQAEASQKTFETALQITRSVLEHLFPAACALHGTQEITTFLTEAFVSLKEEPKVMICMHPDSLEKMKGRLSEIVSKSGFSGKVVLSKDDALSPADCTIEWKNGGIERKTEDILKEIDALLQQYAKAADKGENNG